MKDGDLKTGFGGGFGLYDGVLFKYPRPKPRSSSSPLDHRPVLSHARPQRGRAFDERLPPDEHKNSIHIAMFNATAAEAACAGAKGVLRRFVDPENERAVERFNGSNAEDWHSSRGIPWKLGVVLFGRPVRARPASSTRWRRISASISSI